MKDTGRRWQAPAIQNIPIRTEAGRELQRAFAAREGDVLVDIDFTAIEFRIFRRAQRAKKADT